MMKMKEIDNPNLIKEEKKKEKEDIKDKQIKKDKCCLF